MKKAKILTTVIVSILLMSQSCDLTREEYGRITPELFYRTPDDAELAVAGLYNRWVGLWGNNHFSLKMISDVTAGTYLRGTVGTGWDNTIFHRWTPENGAFTQNFFPHYNTISEARLVAINIERMDIPDVLKRALVAEARVMAGQVAFHLYDMYGPLPWPTDEQLANPHVVEYPARPTFEQQVQYIEDLLLNYEHLADPSFGAHFGRVNKGVGMKVLMKLYMLEAGRTGNQEFYSKAQAMAEALISSGWYDLRDNYHEATSIALKQNNEIIWAISRSYQLWGTSWHAETLPSNYDMPMTRAIGAWAVYRMLWSTYDKFDADDYRRDLILAEYTTREGVVVNRENPVSDRTGVGGGPFFGLKYDDDPNRVGFNSAHSIIDYRYSGVILLMAEILNELGTNANVNAPSTTQTAKDGTPLASDGGTDAYSFINAIRVRTGLTPLSGLSKDEFRKAVLDERGFEHYGEGVRRRDLIRHQRVTGDVVFNPDETRFLYPIPVSYINEFKGNMAQNPGY